MKNWKILAIVATAFVSVPTIAQTTDPLCPLDPLKWGNALGEGNPHVQFADLINKALSLDGVKVACVETIKDVPMIIMPENHTLKLPQMRIELNDRIFGNSASVTTEISVKDLIRGDHFEGTTTSIRTCTIRFLSPERKKAAYSYLISGCEQIVSNDSFASHILHEDGVQYVNGIDFEKAGISSEQIEQVRTQARKIILAAEIFKEAIASDNNEINADRMSLATYHLQGLLLEP